VILCHTSERGFITSGIAVLAFDAAMELRPLVEVATQLSRAMVENGDLPPLLAVG